MSENSSSNSVDEYIAGFPETVQKKLQEMRTTIREAAPEATETINYGSPTFQLHGNLVHFAAFKKHIGFYPTPSGIEAFQDELSLYKGATGSVQFPLDQPLPLNLVRQIVVFRVGENQAKAAAKSKKKAKK